jgi:sodium transport system permease protein
VRLTRPIRAVFGLEIRSLLRDRRTVFMSVILPILLLPVILLGMTWMEDRQTERDEARTFRVAIVGPEADLARALLGADPSPGAPPGSPGAASPAAEPGTGKAPDSRFRWVTVEDAEAALESERIDLLLEALTPEAWTTLREAAEADTDPLPPQFDGVPVFRLQYNASRTASREGAWALQDRLVGLRELRRDSLLHVAGFPAPRDAVAVLHTVDVASADEVQGAMLGRYITLLLLGLMVLGGSALSTDTLAGEKERGTLATLLTSAATRNELVAGKLLAIMAVAFAIAVVQVVNLWVFLGLGLIEPPSNLALRVSPELAFYLLVLFLPVVALTAGVLLLASAYANSYKEAQLYLTPVLVGLLVPALAPLVPDLTLPSAILLVPIANLALVARDLMIGQVHAPSLLASWGITAAAAAWVTSRSVRALHSEKVVTGDTTREEFLGGPDLFRKRVLRWFLVFWAVKLLFDLNLRFDDIRMAALFSVGFLFLAFPLVVIRYFRLDPVQALALRAPRPGVWIGVLLGAPAGLLAAQAVFQLMQFVIPVPTEVLESFGQTLLPEGVPTWQLLLLLALLPGVAEELTFRGVLLHGLRRRFGTLGLALLVGGIFGFFHFQLFRIPSTAMLGVVLTLVTLYSGSIFPAMVWHALNNGLAVVLATRGWGDTLVAGWMGAAGVGGLLLALAIIWFFRTPYPEVGMDREPVPRRRSPKRPGTSAAPTSRSG